jgi:MFS family permease
MTAFLPFVHLVPSAMDAGIDAPRAATLIALIGAGSMAGRFAVGGFADRLGRQRSLATAYAVLGLASIAWWADRSFPVLAAFALVHGTAYGVSVALFPSIAMDWFGARNLAGLIGLLYTGAGFGSVIGPMGAGWWYDRSGGYDLAILLSAAASLVPRWSRCGFDRRRVAEDLRRVCENLWRVAEDLSACGASACGASSTASGARPAPAEPARRAAPRLPASCRLRSSR